MRKKMYNEKEICRLYTEEKMSSLAIAKTYNTYDTTILDILKRNKVKIRLGKEARKLFCKRNEKQFKLNVSLDEFNEMIRDYESNKTLESIAKEHNVRLGTMIGEFRKHNVHIRTNSESHKKYNLDKTEICAAYRSGKNAYQIAKEQCVNKETIYRLLKECKVERRNKREAYEPHETGPKRYIYNGMTFDSQYELVVYIYCIYNNIPIYRNQREFGFRYIDTRNVERTVYPDFIINGSFVEIKGAQFFKSDGTMFLPYRRPEWSDEEYEYRSKIYADKQKCLLDNNCIIYSSNSQFVQMCLKFVNRLYENCIYDNWYDIYCKPNINHNSISFGFTPYNLHIIESTDAIKSIYSYDLDKTFIVISSNFILPF